MKQISLITICLTLVLFSCGKKKVLDWTKNSSGYIYNSNDNTPFKNTKFKIYYHTYANGVSKDKVEEEYFYTDENGHFNFTTSITGGLLVWPSYSYGAVYVGPPHFGNPKSENVDNAKRIYTDNYDTLYTTPYY
jgi:hypothetical protein